VRCAVTLPSFSSSTSHTFSVTDLPVGWITPVEVSTGPVWVPRQVYSTTTRSPSETTVSTVIVPSGNPVANILPNFRAPSGPVNVSPVPIKVIVPSGAIASAPASKFCAFQASYRRRIRVALSAM
jgi:hypothetical protein